MHNNLKFAYEIENNLRLSFIGVNVLKTDNGFMSSIHLNKHIQGYIQIFVLILPDTYKKGAFTGLLFRIYSICSNWSIVNDEFAKLRKMFADNCYPTYLLDKCINQFCLKSIIRAI